MAGASTCADCGTTLVESAPEGWSARPNAEAMRPVEAYAADSTVEVDLVEAQLRAAGIPTARRPRRVALFVRAADLASAQQVLQGRPPGALPETFGLSELHRIRLVCAECEKGTSVDLLNDRLPDRCPCGRYFDLSEARLALDRYTDLMRTMADADFDIEIEVPEVESGEG
jgi:hypothetical protein